MTAEVLSQLKVLRGGLADTVQGDPRYLTLSALDKSVAEIGAVASAAPGEAGAVPFQVLGQLKTIRDGIAGGLRNDHRYLTLSALDKSIAEIGGMLAAAGLIAPEHAAPLAPVHFEPVAPAATSVAPVSDATAPVAPASAQPAAPPPKKSKLKPVLETAAVVAAGVLAAEVIGSETKPLAKSKPKPAGDATKSETDAKVAGDETETAEAEQHDDEAGEAKADDAGSETSDNEGAAGDEAHAEAADHDDAADATEAEDADSETSKDEEASEETDAESADHGDETAEPKPKKAAGTDASESHADEHESKPADDGDAMPDAAGIVPKGKASGYVPMAAKAGAAQYQPGISVKFGKLPNQVDLRPLMTPIEDQGDTSSCVANAVAGAYEYWVKKASKQDTNISRLFIYYNARWRGGSQDKDDGSVIQLAMEGLSKFGACPETVWPFDPRLVLKKPGGEAYKDAAPFRVQDMAQVPMKLDAWKQALAEGKPIVFGCALFDSFDECSKRGGVVPMPSPDDVARAKHSGHSMCAVGYSDTEKVFIVRNSWGADWGDKGYCYMPYDYLLNEKFNDGDNWVFVPKVPMQPPREVWSNTTDPVTNSGHGVDFPIAAYSITDYENIVVDLFEHVRRPFNATILEDYGQYVSWASQSLWSEFETFDFATFLTSTAALTGVTSLATEFLSETSETTESSESSEESDEESEETDETDADEADTDDDASEDDSPEDDESEEDDDSDKADDDSEGDEESDDDADDAESDEDSEDESTEDKDESEGDGAEGDEEAEDDEDGDGDDDAEEDADDSGEDDGGGEDEGGGDEEGGDDDE